MSRGLLLCAALVLGPGTLGASTAVTDPRVTDPLDTLYREYWDWAVQNRPLSVHNNNAPRIERPAGWRPDWSAESVERRRRELGAFEKRWAGHDVSSWPVPRQVDYRVVGALMARDRYDLDHLKGWQRNPMFYLDHTIGAVRDLLLPPPPFDERRAEQVLLRLANIPRVVDQARANLTDARAPLARFAVDWLKDIGPRLRTVAGGLKPLFPPAQAARLDASIEGAATALESYRSWLEGRLPALPPEVAIGRDAVHFYQTRVALNPYSVEEMRAMARQYDDELAVWQAVELARNAGAPPAAPLPDAAAVVVRAAQDDLAIRALLEDKGLLSVPEWLGRFRMTPMPAYLLAIAGGSMNDLTSPARLRTEATYYVTPPAPNSDLYLDPRLIISQAGVPGHFTVLSLGWHGDNPIRARYVDHQPNEGLAYYSMLLLLRAGAYDDVPRTREALLRSMRTRPRKFEWDLRLATGDWSYDRAIKHYPHSPGIVGDPGLTSSNLMGALQIWSFLAAAREAKGDQFVLRDFHDYLWSNGNVPVSLLRWEYLGLRDQVDRLDARAARSGGGQ